MTLLYSLILDFGGCILKIFKGDNCELRDFFLSNLDPSSFLYTTLLHLLVASVLCCIKVVEWTSLLFPELREHGSGVLVQNTGENSTSYTIPTRAQVREIKMPQGTFLKLCLQSKVSRKCFTHTLHETQAMPIVTSSACSAFCCYSYDWEYWWRYGEVPKPPLTTTGDSEVPALDGPE